MRLEGPKFRLWFDPGISADEFNKAAGAICRVLVAGPPEPPGHRRTVAVRQCLALYSGARSNRAKQLADRYRSYLAGAWSRERDLVELAEPRTVEKVCLHRLARLNDGRSLGWRQLFDIASCPHE